MWDGERDACEVICWECDAGSSIGDSCDLIDLKRVIRLLFCEIILPSSCKSLL
jgi:hypothetical protein